LGLEELQIHTQFNPLKTGTERVLPLKLQLKRIERTLPTYLQVTGAESNWNKEIVSVSENRKADYWKHLLRLFFLPFLPPSAPRSNIHGRPGPEAARHKPVCSDSKVTRFKLVSAQEPPKNGESAGHDDPLIAYFMIIRELDSRCLKRGSVERRLLMLTFLH
jgi:hypothetical protein